MKFETNYWRYEQTIIRYSVVLKNTLNISNANKKKCVVYILVDSVSSTYN